MKDLTPQPPLRCGEGETDLPHGVVPPFPPREGGPGGVGLALLVLALLAHCQCNSRSADADVDADPDTDAYADADADADSDSDIDIDIDIVGDPDIDEDDAEFEAEAMELCGEDDRPFWSFRPYDCPPYERPRDCCASCQLVTCREYSHDFDIWDDRVVHGFSKSVGMVNLSTGEDTVVFSGRDTEDGGLIVYFDPSISSRYIVAWKMDEREEDGEMRTQEAVVARRLSDLSGPEIVLEEHEELQSIVGLRVYEEWVVWTQRPPSTGYNESILHNIETGERRIINRNHSDYSTSLPSIWGDRIVWGANGDVLEEYRISTGETRVVFDPTSEMEYVGSVRIWDHYVVYNPQPSRRGFWEVFLVDLDTGEARVISPSDANKDQASIHNGRVIWTNYRGSDSHLGMHINIYSIRTGLEYVLNPSTRISSNPLIFDRNVVWHGVTAEGVRGYWVTRIGDI